MIPVACSGHTTAATNCHAAPRMQVNQPNNSNAVCLQELGSGPACCLCCNVSRTRPCDDGLAGQPLTVFHAFLTQISVDMRFKLPSSGNLLAPTIVQNQQSHLLHPSVTRSFRHAAVACRCSTRHTGLGRAHVLHFEPARAAAGAAAA